MHERFLGFPPVHRPYGYISVKSGKNYPIYCFKNPARKLGVYTGINGIYIQFYNFISNPTDLKRYIKVSTIRGSKLSWNDFAKFYHSIYAIFQEFFISLSLSFKVLLIGLWASDSNRFVDSDPENFAPDLDPPDPVFKILALSCCNLISFKVDIRFLLVIFIFLYPDPNGQTFSDPYP